jgi:hypothetical protein
VHNHGKPRVAGPGLPLSASRIHGFDVDIVTVGHRAAAASTSQEFLITLRHMGMIGVGAGAEVMRERIPIK